MKPLAAREYCWSVLLLLAAAALACYAMSLQPAVSPAHLACCPAVYDFGVVRRGTLDGRITLINRADVAIQILHVVVSCTCQKVELPRARLEPRDAVEAQFTWDARGEQDEAGSRFTVAFRLAGEDQLRYLVCPFRAHILPPFEFAPGQFGFSLARKEVQTAAVECWCSDAPNFSLEWAKCLHPALSVTCDLKNRKVVVSFDPSKWQDADAGFSPQVQVKASTDPGFGYSIPVYIRD